MYGPMHILTTAMLYALHIERGGMKKKKHWQPGIILIKITSCMTTYMWKMLFILENIKMHKQDFLHTYTLKNKKDHTAGKTWCNKYSFL